MHHDIIQPRNQSSPSKPLRIVSGVWVEHPKLQLVLFFKTPNLFAGTLERVCAVVILQITVFMDTAVLPKSLLLYVPLYLEMVFESPVLRDGGEWEGGKEEAEEGGRESNITSPV